MRRCGYDSQVVQALGLGLPAVIVARNRVGPLAAVFCVQVFVAVDRHSHSVSDTVYGIFPFVVPCLMVLNWVASKTSPQNCRRSVFDP